MLKLLKKHKEADVFLDPVDWEGLGLEDYPSVVTHPMDLGTVQAKLDGGRYVSVLEAAADVELIWSNSMLYNPSDNWVHQAALELKGVADKRLAALLIGARARIEGAAAPSPPPPAVEAAPVPMATLIVEEDQAHVSTTADAEQASAAPAAPAEAVDAAADAAVEAGAPTVASEAAAMAEDA